MKSEIERTFNISLPSGQSAFLWGARKTGKTTWLRQKYPNSTWFDLLDTDLFVELIKRPALLREQVLALAEQGELKQPIVIDEVQKVPMILDEVHKLIEEHGLQFLLCGSSARKLKREHANLLGGRAWRFEMFPLVSHELENLDLMRALQQGFIPSHYFSSYSWRSLESYVTEYLVHEIKAEGLARNLPAFARFLDAAAFSNTELVNYSNIARDCGVDSKTVREYFDILKDTLLGYLIEPWSRKDRGDSIAKAPKFYFFDTGLAQYLQKRRSLSERGVEFGKAFEQFILMELLAYRGYQEHDYEIRFWRSKSGQEIDFILGDGEIAIEVKGSPRVDSRDLKAIQDFAAAYPSAKTFVVSREKNLRKVGQVTVFPWRTFLNHLWAGKLF